MAAVLGLYRSSIGKKVVMALTGFVLVGFVIAHMVGNLKAFQGPEKLNAYGVFLRDVGGPIFGHEQLLWIVRLVLLASVVLHIVAAVQLARGELAARPVRYAYHKKVQATYASRTMRWGGMIILLFVIYHLLHFTVGSAHPSFRSGDIYHNLVSGFQVWYVSAFYIAAMIALGLHLYHGVWSMFHTLGLNNRTYNRLLRGTAAVVAGAVALGNISIPVAVLVGWIK
ncbi:MAG TPA: succinate dehydrogenase cytochrome b subunit [Herpetosiphonaceae bacterium]|nr:succinate dehydrogenase cytochrome b subunit [Herpetosiphonaceae bacterium]